MLRFFLLFLLLSFLLSPAPEIEEEREVHILSPYSNLPLEDQIEMRRTVVATIANSFPARPQAGLEYADIVYEFLVEGGITRFLALFSQHYPERVGPIRSARPYLLEKALEFDPIYLHIGGSNEAYNLLSQIPLDNLDEIGSGSAYYYRCSERRAPYNLYIDLLHIPHLKVENPSSSPYLRFKDSIDREETHRESKEITIYYWGGHTVHYIYEEEEGVYLRYHGNQPHLTEEGTHLLTHNLLILHISTRVVDEGGRLHLDFTEGGPLLFFRDGTVIEGHWVKKEGETHYLDKEGEELLFKTGRTWVNAVPLSANISY